MEGYGLGIEGVGFANFGRDVTPAQYGSAFMRYGKNHPIFRYVRARYLSDHWFWRFRLDASTMLRRKAMGVVKFDRALQCGFDVRQLDLTIPPALSP